MTKRIKFGDQERDLIDWDEISARGLLERINREIMHPLGLAVCRIQGEGTSPGAIVAPDGVFTYALDDENDE